MSDLGVYRHSVYESRAMENEEVAADPQIDPEEIVDDDDTTAADGHLLVRVSAQRTFRTREPEDP